MGMEDLNFLFAIWQYSLLGVLALCVIIVLLLLKIYL
jgi:hypothetical protein